MAKKKSRAIEKRKSKAEEHTATWNAVKRILCGAGADWGLYGKWELLKSYVADHDEAAAKGDQETCKRIRGYLVERRHKNGNWIVADENGKPYSSIKEGVNLAVLLDIRDLLNDHREKLAVIAKKLPARKRKARRAAEVSQ